MEFQGYERMYYSMCQVDTYKWCVKGDQEYHMVEWISRMEYRGYERIYVSCRYVEMVLSRKVRPRTSAWYQLYVEATKRNLILPDLPG